MRRRLAIAVLAVLPACALLNSQENPSGVDAIVAEALAASRAPAAEQKAALARAQRKFIADASWDNRLRLATMLATLPAPLHDDVRAAELLESLADAASPGAGRFAALLAAQIAERQRLARELERVRREREKAESEHERADKERDKREEALRQQLEALRSIERGILEREERMRRKAK
ncbi:MAG TPA: hypothetical protein VNH12_10885 [Burkholderiales bacterium]|nr:hypothetical protein [Burkholderiales bacterium]